MSGYTIVQHSAWVGKRDPDFQYALETRAVTKKREEDTIRGLGGVVFDDYTEADNWCMDEQYKGVDGLIAKAPGSFSNVTIDGLPLYIPLPPLEHKPTTLLDTLEAALSEGELSGESAERTLSRIAAIVADAREAQDDESTHPCPSCGGEGMVDGRRCRECSGVGLVTVYQAEPYRSEDLAGGQ